MASTLNDNIVNIKDRFDIVHKIKHCGQLILIDEINANEFNVENFKKNYFKANRPLVIRQALNVLDFGSAYENWSLDYLNEKCGNNKVFVRRNTIADTYKTGKAYQVQEIEFKSYVQDLNEDNDRAQNSYLAVQNLRKAFSQVYNELKMPPQLVEKLHAGPFLWIARAQHYEFTHMDPDDNLLMVLRGQKIVRLYDCIVEPLKPNPLGSKGRTIQSQINCYSAIEVENEHDLEKFKQVTCHYCLLEEGDVLYFPAFWWHQVTSPQKTISINVFFGDSGDNEYTKKLLASPQRNAFFYWLFNIIQQNRAYESFNRLLPHLKSSIKSFLFKQWHEILNDEQITVIYNEIVNYFKFDTNFLADNELKDGVKHPPKLKIRGLLWRTDDNEKDDGDND